MNIKSFSQFFSIDESLNIKDNEVLSDKFISSVMSECTDLYIDNYININDLDEEENILAIEKSWEYES